MMFHRTIERPASAAAKLRPGEEIRVRQPEAAFWTSRRKVALIVGVSAALWAGILSVAAAILA